MNKTFRNGTNQINSFPEQNVHPPCSPAMRCSPHRLTALEGTPALLTKSARNPSSSRSPWPHAADMNHPPEPTALGKRGTAGISAPNLTISGGNRSPSAALSVITEASDEDTRHFKKHRKYMAKTVETDETASHHGTHFVGSYLLIKSVFDRKG